MLFKPKSSVPETLRVGTREIPLLLIPNSRARRYLLRLRPDGTAAVTVPAGGALSYARDFARANVQWLETQLARPPRLKEAWRAGNVVFLRGEPVQISLDSSAAGRPIARVGSEAIPVADTAADLRPEVEARLWKLAAEALPPRVLELAALHRLTVGRVTIRSQKSRWGSCSRSGAISLNWRLIQTPPFVSDYIILHELMHLKQMNHSPRFWREVELVCPEYMAAERWLKCHSRLLR